MITSRKRKLLNVAYNPNPYAYSPLYDSSLNLLTQPLLSSSQRFAADRSKQLAALQNVRSGMATPMSTPTYMALQSRLRAGEFEGMGGTEVDLGRLREEAGKYLPPPPAPSPATGVIPGGTPNVIPGVTPVAQNDNTVGGQFFPA